MPRQRSPSRDKAKQMYLDSKGEMLLKDIASQLNVNDTQVRKWKSQDKWEEELKGNVTNRKSNVTKQSKGIDGQPKVDLLPEEIQTLNNEELTEKQRLFCLYYVRWFNATKAYQKAYGCDYTTAMVNGCKLLSNPKIQTHIQTIHVYGRGLLPEDDRYCLFRCNRLHDVRSRNSSSYGSIWPIRSC